MRCSHPNYFRWLQVKKMMRGEAWNFLGPSSRSLQALNERAASLATKSRASSTKRKYWSHLGKFQCWGSNMDPPLPASPQTVVLFLTDLSDRALVELRSTVTFKA